MEIIARNHILLTDKNRTKKYKNDKIRQKIHIKDTYLLEYVSFIV